MSIVSSAIEKYPQANGSVMVIERHTDHLGQQHMQSWYAASNNDTVINDAVSAHAAQLEDELANAEIESVLT